MLELVISLIVTAIIVIAILYIISIWIYKRAPSNMGFIRTGFLGTKVCLGKGAIVLPVFHGNDRVEWFLQLSDEIVWDIGDKNTGAPRARITMRAGDICAMPADIRHQGYSTKRSMLLVWENATPNLPKRYESGELPPYPIQI